MVECFERCHPVEGLSRPAVELCGDGVEVGLGERSETGALGEVTWRMAPSKIPCSSRTSKSAAARFLNSVVLRSLPKRNVAKGLGGRQPYGGSQWWALPDDVARGVLDFCDRETRFVRFFSRSRIPDEMFFQTVVGALPGGRELRPPLTFADWSQARREATGSRPAILGSDDLALLQSCDGYFARKFDASVDAAVFDLIDAELLAPLAR